MIEPSDAIKQAQREDDEWRARPSTCPACPDGCSSCTRDRSDCECYEHQGHYDESNPLPNLGEA